MDKNNRTITGYENFRIIKDTLELIPFQDFDFAGKHVVCLKCYQQFASKMSYSVHVGTDICVRFLNVHGRRNDVYLKQKKINKKQQKNNVSKNRLLSSNISNTNLLNPKKLDALETRNNCYLDSVLERKNKKPRGKSKKNIEVEPTRRGKPINSSTLSDCNLSPKINKKCLNDKSESNNESMFKKPKIASVSSFDAYNNGESEILNSKKKFLTDCAPNILNSDKIKDLDIKSYQNVLKQTPSSENAENNLFLDEELIVKNVESPKEDNQSCDQDLQKINRRFTAKIDLISSKRKEKIKIKNKENKDQKTDNFSRSITNKGDKSNESAQEDTRRQFKHGTGTRIIKNHINKNKECEEILLKNEHINSVPSLLPVIYNTNSTSTDYSLEKIFFCKLCKKQFKFLNVYFRHVKTHIKS